MCLWLINLSCLPDICSQSQKERKAVPEDWNSDILAKEKAKWVTALLSCLFAVQLN